MFGVIFKKECRIFFKSTGNLIFVFALPILLILLMGSALKGYVSTDFKTFDDGIVYYHYEEKTMENDAKLQEFESLLLSSTGVILEEVTDYEKGVEDVKSSNAFGIIQISGDTMDYYRSPYNETNGGKLVHSLFEQALLKNTNEIMDNVNVTEITAQGIDSSSYATFTYLSFTIMFIALMTGHSVIDERRYGTIERLKISKAGLNTLVSSKLILGLVMGVLQIATVWIFSTYILDVKWGEHTLIMFLVLISLVIMSSVFGVVIGMISKNKSIADNTILMTVMLSGYIGGAMSPIYLLENANILKQIIKISPLYWSGRALTNLYVGILDMDTIISIGLSFILALIFFTLYKLQSKKVNLKL